LPQYVHQTFPGEDFADVVSMVSDSGVAIVWVGRWVRFKANVGNQPPWERSLIDSGGRVSG
jgi:hypothetical protein